MPFMNPPKSNKKTFQFGIEIGEMIVLLFFRDLNWFQPYRYFLAYLMIARDVLVNYEENEKEEVAKAKDNRREAEKNVKSRQQQQRRRKYNHLKTVSKRERVWMLRSFFLSFGVFYFVFDLFICWLAFVNSTNNNKCTIKSVSTVRKIETAKMHIYGD